MPTEPLGRAVGRNDGLLPWLAVISSARYVDPSSSLDVAWTALDARKLGFTTYVIEDATRGIDLNGSLAAAWKQMTEAGVKRIQSSDIA